MRRVVAAAWLAALAILPGAARSEDKLSVVATFSIVADLTQRIGGSYVEIATLVGPDTDAHIYQPGPRESAELAEADVLIANGLGFEPWLGRLTEASGFAGTVIEASAGIEPLSANEEDKGGEEHAGHGAADPHAFQNPANAQVYAANIAAGLGAAAPAHAAEFQANAERLIAEIAALDRELKAAFAAIPQVRRRVLTTHEAFRYFGRAYGIEFVSVQGISTEAEPTTQELARIVRQARDGRVSAVFLENMSNSQMAETVAQEASVRVGGALYADALSGPEGPAADYLSLIRHNAEQLLAALR